MTPRLARALVVVALWSCAVPAQAAFTLVNHAVVNNNSAATVTTTAMSCTGADLIVLAAGYYAGGGPVITDSSSNTWHALTAQTSTGYGSETTYYATKFDGGFTVSASQTFTLTVNSSGYLPALAVECWSGSLTTTSPLDTQVGNVCNTCTTVQPGANGSTTGELMITTLGTGVSTAGNETINSAYTVEDVATGGGLTGAAIAYLNPSAGAVNPTWTTSTGGSQSMSTTHVGFKPAGGGGGGTNLSPALSMLGVR